MHNNATRRFATLILTMYLTYALGLSVVTTTLKQPAGSQVVAGQKESPASTKHSTPKRDTIVSESDYVRAQARIWFHQNIDGYHAEWICIDEIIHRESRWIPNLWNTQGSEAYGLGQVKGSYHYTHGRPIKQFKVAIKYAIHKYGTMCKALAAHDRQGWY